MTPLDDVIYLDCHSTTPVDPVVLAAMLPYFSQAFGNTGSLSHAYGMQARDGVADARMQFAEAIGATSDEIVFTSGATESNNLAIFGSAQRWQGKRNHLITLGIEHPSVLEPLRQLQRQGWRLTILPVPPQSDAESASSVRQPGVVDLAALESVLDEDTALVSLAVANNEIGVIQPVDKIADMVHNCGGWFHIDASQAVGWLPVDVKHWRADLVSFSGHKFYGPKGSGALFVRSQATYPGARPLRLHPQLIGGGQEFGFRSGTLNSPGIIGLGQAMVLASRGYEGFAQRVSELRGLLWSLLQSECPELELNGPTLLDPKWRLPNNLNFAVPGVEGQSIQLHTPGVALSSGSACSSATPGVSSVLKALGCSEDRARSSLRLGLGRFHTEKDIERAAKRLIAGIRVARNSA